MGECTTHFNVSHPYVDGDFTMKTAEAMAMVVKQEITLWLKDDSANKTINAQSDAYLLAHLLVTTRSLVSFLVQRGDCIRLLHEPILLLQHPESVISKHASPLVGIGVSYGLTSEIKKCNKFDVPS